MKAKMLKAKMLKLLGGTLSFSVLLFPLAMPGLAAYTRPRDAQPPSTATGTSGTRNGIAQLTLLAPLQHVGYSQSTHPTFEWFVPVENSFPGEFQLYEVIETGEVTETGEPDLKFQRVLETPHKFVSDQGFMSFTMPADMAGLKPNTNYIWQVLLRYGPSPSDIFKMRSQVEITENLFPSALPTEPSTQQTAARIEQLAVAGLWYDALALTAELPPSEAVFLKNSLLVALADIEATDDLELEALEIDDLELDALDSATVEEIPHSHALRQIVEWQNSAQMGRPTANLPPT